MDLKELTVASAVSADVVSAPIAEAVDRVALSHERIILTRDGKPVAAMVPLADVAALEAIEDAADAEAAAAALAEWKAAGRPLGSTLEALAERHGIDLRARDA
jgi:antitoxin (DNA-binding transcriptional repressor) of toxin-antitoxin stability system